MTIPYLMNCPHTTAGWCSFCVAELGRSAEKDRKDAERYRFIRANPESDVLLCQDQPAGYNGSLYMSLDLAWKAKRCEKYTPEHLDAAIDEAMRTTEPLLVAPLVTIDVPDCPMDVYRSMDMGDG